MRLPRIGIAFLALISITVATPLTLNLTTLSGVPQVLAQTPANRKAEADRLFQQGIQQFSTSQFEAALQSWQQALTLYQEINDRQGEAHALTNIGLAYSTLGDSQKAIDSYQQSLAIARAIKDTETEGRALQNLGLAYMRLRDYQKATDFLEQALAIAERIQDLPSKGRALGNLGDIYKDLGNVQRAIDFYQKALAIARAIPDRQFEGAILSLMGSAYSQLGDYQKAIDHFEQSLVIVRQVQDRQAEGVILRNLGSAYNNFGDSQKAIDLVQQSLAIARQLQDRMSEAYTLGTLAEAYQDLGNYQQAIDIIQQSLAIARAIKDPATEGAALAALGNVYENLGSLQQAIGFYEQSLAIARKIPDPSREAAVLGNLGLIYSTRGDYQQARDFHQQSLGIYQKIQNPRGEGNALNNLGNVYLRLGDYQKARDSYQKALAIYQKIQNLQGQGLVIGNLGLVYGSLGDYPKAIDSYQKALAIVRQTQNPDSEGTFLNNLGLDLFKSGKLAEAEATLREGSTVLESIRKRSGGDANKVSIFETQARTYRNLQQVLIAANKTDAALEIAERGRARAFVELLTSRLSHNPTQQLTVTPPTIEQIKQIAKKQNATLVQYSIIKDLEVIAEKGQGKELELYIWVVKPTGEVGFRKVDLKSLDTPLENLVTSSRQSLGVPGRATAEIVLNPGTDQKQRLQKLHDLLIKPIADLLPTDSSAHVIFIPQQELFLVPFAALQDEREKYLIEKHTILTAPSIQVLELTRQKRERVGARGVAPLQGRNTLIAGNPTMPSISLNIGEKAQKLLSLPGAEREAIEIAKQFNTQALLGSQATETTIKSQLPKADIIHFATHGLLDYGQLQGQVRQGVPGAIALAPDGKEDGLLTSDEILDLNLNASLVVLSACDTGRGDITSDGIIGLSRSFITAGTPSIIVSLWSVPDAPTAELMKAFYLQLQQNPDKAQALRQAMLSIMKQRPYPKDWAAFTLIGEAE